MGMGMARQTLSRIFSGIQPTGGSLHLGNYFGAVKRWAEDLREQDLLPDQRLYSIVDMHAITLPKEPDELRRNIFNMTASLLACGIDPDKCILFQQSKVLEHFQLAWILGCHCTVPQLGRLSQYKEKSAKLKEVPLGLYVYPVLQSADILLYKATHIPVGEDNVQNIQIAQQVCKSFNNKYGEYFPSPKAILLDSEACRVKSLRNPEKKMSKSDPDWRSCIYLDDTPEIVIEKCKKAVTDFTGTVTYDPKTRPGVSNLVMIHSEFTGLSIDQVCESVKDLNTGQYKLVLAEVINEHLTPIREKISHYQRNQDTVRDILAHGADKARNIAKETMEQVLAVIGAS